MHDSTVDTINHIGKVQRHLEKCKQNLAKRQHNHDASKLRSPEKEAYDRLGDNLRKIKYNSPEYKAALASEQPAIRHHYEHNSHHPEHYPDGVAGMSLFDVIEMLMDWKAAGERTNEGDIRKSLEINAKRFNMAPVLVSILENTIEEMGW